MQTIPSFLLQVKKVPILFYVLIASIAFYGCNSSAGNSGGYEQPMQVLPVFIVNSVPATNHIEYSAALEGSKDIEIRPQVEGYLDKIYVDEGAFVRKGQSLFHINDRPYSEQLKTAKAALTAAKANLVNAEINVSKLTPLVKNNVVSDVQLKTAQAAYDAAASAVEQAKTLVESGQVNVG